VNRGLTINRWLRKLKRAMPGPKPSKRRVASVAIPGIWRLFLILSFPVWLVAQRTQPISAPQPSHEAALGSIAGTVRAADGTSIRNLELRLADVTTGVIHTVRSDDEGAFTFGGLPSGKYLLSTGTPSVQITSVSEIDLKDGQQYRLQTVEVRIVSRTTVDVVATEKEVAEAQVEQEGKQKVLGFIPNYYTVFIPNAAPLTPKLKFRLSMKSIFDPMTFAGTAALAGVEQKHNTFPGYEQGGEGYARRYGATFADTVSHRIFASAVFPTLFHQDPRYFYKGSGSTKSRIAYALLSTVICKGDNGKLEPNYSQFAGAFTAAGVSNLYRSPMDRQVGLTFRNGFIILGGNAVTNVLRELISKRLTSNLPSSQMAKP
jgi:Carboxypeptidase regulatory-like domain